VDTDFGGVEGIAGHAAEQREKSDAWTQGGIRLGVAAEGYGVEDFLLLSRRAGEIRIGVAVDAKIFKPHQPPAETMLDFLFSTSEKMDEWGSAGFDGTGGVVIFGDDGTAESGERGVLSGGEILWDVLPCCGFFAADDLMDVFRRFGGDDLQDRTADSSH